MLAETGEEVNRGWAVGPFPAVPDGFVVSRRFQLIQGNSIRMIDDFTISGINDTAVSQNKIDLHMVDTFAAMIREFFLRCNEAGMASNLVAKTYDLKNVYKQIPIRTDHLCFSYFFVFPIVGSLEGQKFTNYVSYPSVPRHTMYTISFVWPGYCTRFVLGIFFF